MTIDYGYCDSYVYTDKMSPYLNRFHCIVFFNTLVSWLVQLIDFKVSIKFKETINKNSYCFIL